MAGQPDPNSDETIALPQASPTGVSSVSANSRLSRTVYDEGRFVPGTLLANRYRILNRLGAGGMGEVYRATDLLIGEAVALKFLPEAAVRDERILARFQSEVRVARQVSHPNVCRVHDIGEVDGVPFISMEYVDGEDLSTLIKRIGRLPQDKAIDTARKICAGLAAAHDRGIIHRDLKPQNIMLNRAGVPVILDFGLAAVADTLSGAEARHGTPAYMSPEQLKGTEVTARSDFYALGLVLYELFTGRKAFDAKSIPELISKQEAIDLTSMTSIAAEIDPAVDNLIRRCLDPDPARRPASALSIAAALPGGDPLAAALAAGETPSPELVAAAGRTGALAKQYSLPCLIVTFAVVVAAPFLSGRVTAYTMVPHDLTPAVLERKAIEVAAQMGYSARPKDTHVRLVGRSSLMNLLHRQPGGRDHGKLKEWLSRESPLMAIVRTSPEWMFGTSNGFIDDDNPALTKRGMTLVALDGHGYLRGFRGIPAQLPPGASFDPVPVFRAIGWDPAQFAETDSQLIPTAPSDRVMSFRGKPEVLPGVEIVIDMASWRGQLTELRILFPWMTADGQRKPQGGIPEELIVGASFVAAAVGILFAVLLAVRNWKLNRTDRQGAFRLAVFQYSVVALVWLLAAHFPPAAPTGNILLIGGVQSLLVPLACWTLYLALEPLVRARWPQALITWSRLLSGHWRDAQVNGHALVGIAVGALVWAVLTILQILEGVPDSVNDPEQLKQAGLWVARLGGTVGGAVITGMVLLFVFLGLRVLLRRDWIAAVVSAVILAVLTSGNAAGGSWALRLGAVTLLFGLMIYLLLRLGLVATIALVCTINWLGGLTLGTDWSQWYTSYGVARLALLGAVTAWTFRDSLGGQDLFGHSEHAATS